MVGREIPAWASYFYFYELFKHVAEVDSCGPEASKLERCRSFFYKMVFGGLAGQISWIISYPFD